MGPIGGRFRAGPDFVDVTNPEPGHALGASNFLAGLDCLAKPFLEYAASHIACRLYHDGFWPERDRRGVVPAHEPRARRRVDLRDICRGDGEAHLGLGRTRQWEGFGQERLQRRLVRFADRGSRVVAQLDDCQHERWMRVDIRCPHNDNLPGGNQNNNQDGYLVCGWWAPAGRARPCHSCPTQICCTGRAKIRPRREPLSGERPVRHSEASPVRARVLRLECSRAGSSRSHPRSLPLASSGALMRSSGGSGESGERTPPWRSRRQPRGRSGVPRPDRRCRRRGRSGSHP